MEHLGQHHNCCACDANASRESPEAIAARIRRGERAAIARRYALAQGATQSVADRAASYASDEARGLTPAAVLEKAEGGRS